MLPLAAASLLAASLAPSPLPQGGGPVIQPGVQPVLAYPDPIEDARFTPFEDGVRPVAPSRAVHAVGLADFDGDSNLESWFLSTDASGSQHVDVLMPRTSRLGRFRAYGSVAAAGGTWLDAARFRTPTEIDDVVVLANPTRPFLQAVRRTMLPSLNPDPRGRSTYVVAELTWLAFGLGVREVEAFDADGDGLDDLATLSDQNGWTLLQLRTDETSPRTLTLNVPGRADFLRLGDWNGDGRTDVACHVPGLGLAAFVDSGHASTLDFFAGITLNQAPIDVCVGELDGDGRDDLGVVFASGVLTARPTPTPAGGGFAFDALFNPHGLGALAGAAIADVAAETGVHDTADLIVFPADGRAFAVHPWRTDLAGFGPPLCRPLPVTSAPWGQGAGPAGVPALVGDHDHDGDRDVLVQLPDAWSWATLDNPVVSATPFGLQAQDLGAIPGQGFGFEHHRFTVALPQALFDRLPWGNSEGGDTPQLEVALFVEDPQRPDHSLYWNRLLLTPNPVTRTATFDLAVLSDPARATPLINLGMRDYTTFGGRHFVTALGTTTISIHGRVGKTRFGSLLIQHDGQGQGHGSAVGAKWRLVAAPPLPSSDSELLPWD